MKLRECSFTALVQADPPAGRGAGAGGHQHEERGAQRAEADLALRGRGPRRVRGGEERAAAADVSHDGAAAHHGGQAGPQQAAVRALQVSRDDAPSSEALDHTMT